MQLNGTATNDLLPGTGALGATNDTISGNSGDDTLQGGFGNDSLLGGSGNDLMYGGDGADTIRGGANRDVMFGGGGGDVMRGEDGDDRLIGSIVTNIDNLVQTIDVEGSRYAYVPTVSTWYQANIVAQSYTLNGIAGTLAILSTENENNAVEAAFATELQSTEKNAHIGGYKTGLTASGFSWLDGTEVGSFGFNEGQPDNNDGFGGSEDTLHFQFLNNQLGWNDASGNTTKKGFLVEFRNPTTSDTFNLDGGAGNDTLNGGIGNDTLNGGVGNDRMEGLAGDDRYFVDNSNDFVREAADAGYDVVSSTASSYTLGNNVEELVLTTGIDGIGGGTANTITGNNSSNNLNGAAGNDTLIGGAGNDSLAGGLGSDSLLGGAGRDTFVYNARPEGTDTIVNFEATDRLTFNSAQFGNLPVGAVSSANFIAGSNPVPTSNAPTFMYNTNTGLLSYDNNGTLGGAYFELATITGAPLQVSQMSIV